MSRRPRRRRLHDPHARRWKYAYYLDGAEELYDMDTDPDEWTNLALEATHADVTASLRDLVMRFWRPGEHPRRIASTPKVRRQKHWYEFSNQFAGSAGTIADARP